MESLVNLKRNLRSVIPAYGFTPIGVAEGEELLCTCSRKEGKKDTRPFDGSARGSRNEYDLYGIKRLIRRLDGVCDISLFLSFSFFFSEIDKVRYDKRFVVKDLYG